MIANTDSSRMLVRLLEDLLRISYWVRNPNGLAQLECVRPPTDASRSATIDPVSHQQGWPRELWGVLIRPAVVPHCSVFIICGQELPLSTGGQELLLLLFFFRLGRPASRVIPEREVVSLSWGYSSLLWGYSWEDWIEEEEDKYIITRPYLVYLLF